jgi:hypothetical protein
LKRKRRIEITIERERVRVVRRNALSTTHPSKDSSEPAARPKKGRKMTMRILRFTVRSVAMAGLMMSSCLAQPGTAQIEPQAGKWKTWVLAS